MNNSIMRMVNIHINELDKNGETFVKSKTEFKRVAYFYQQDHDKTVGFDENNGIMFVCE